MVTFYNNAHLPDLSEDVDNYYLRPGRMYSAPAEPQPYVRYNDATALDNLSDVSVRHGVTQARGRMRARHHGAVDQKYPPEPAITAADGVPVIDDAPRPVRDDYSDDFTMH